MKDLKKAFISYAVLALSYSLLQAETASLPFLTIVPGAKQAAMGQTGSSMSNGAEAMYWNPSLIGMNKKKEVFLSHSLYLEETSSSYVSFTLPVADKRGVGVSVNYFNSGEINQTDSIGESVGAFQPRDFSFSGGFSIPWEIARFGIAAKYIQSKIIHTATVMTFDAGFSLSIRSNLIISGVLQNAVGKISYIDDPYPLPRTFRFGAGKKINHRWRILAEEVFSRFENPFLALGAECKMADSEKLKSFFRFGFNQGAQRDKGSFAGGTIGGGIQLMRLDLDYSWVPLGDLGQSHILSLNYRGL